MRKRKDLRQMLVRFLGEIEVCLSTRHTLSWKPGVPSLSVYHQNFFVGSVTKSRDDSGYLQI